MGNTQLIEREIKNLQQELKIVSVVLRKKEQEPLGQIEIRGAALSLAALYNGIEGLLKHLLAERQIFVKENQSWHTSVLQKSESLGIISEKTMKDLKAFLAFRHFVRHAYSFEINPITIEAVLDTAPALVERFIKEIQTANEKDIDSIGGAETSI
jgi:uncharacterized protein YutE (UPF0331/DUF86 family)